MTAGGGGTLTVDVSAIAAGHELVATHQGLDASAPYLQLSVTDTGSGIDPAIVARIFEPFYTTKSACGGTGLGLATVHGLVASLGGVIDVDSEPGRGTTFRILLPEAPAPDEADVPTTVAAPTSDPTPGGRRILLVDDEPAILTVTARLLARLGYQVATAPDGRAAMARLEADPGAVDLLVTDLTMPGLGGAALILAFHSLRPELPTILSSGYSDSMTDAERAALAPIRFLQKPYTQAELAAAIEGAFDDGSTSSVASMPSSSDEVG